MLTEANIIAALDRHAELLAKREEFARLTCTGTPHDTTHSWLPGTSCPGWRMHCSRPASFATQPGRW